MLRVTRRELERGYRAHRDGCSPCTSCSHRLLLFYGVECGLKALLMANQKVEDSLGLPEALQFGHNIREALKALRVPSLGVRVVMTRHGDGDQETVEARRLHEAFRYGVALDHEAHVTADLEAIMGWLRERIG